MKEKKRTVGPVEYRTPDVKEVHLYTNRVICSSDEQLQSYQEDEEKFTF